MYLEQVSSGKSVTLLPFASAENSTANVEANSTVIICIIELVKYVVSCKEMSYCHLNVGSNVEQLMVDDCTYAGPFAYGYSLRVEGCSVSIRHETTT